MLEFYNFMNSEDISQSITLVVVCALVQSI